MKSSAIKLTGVTKSFDLGEEEVHILKGINLDIKKNEYASILGQSGSGKSTLMYLVGLLDMPTKGSVHINGIDTKNLSDSEISKLRNEHIGFVFQQFNLINKLTLVENVMLPAYYTRAKLDFDPKKRAIELLERFNLGHRLNSFPNKISGGEQQRTSIARALIMNPELILADEPTGNLDTKNGEIIMTLLDELHRKDKKTVIIVTHEKEISDRTNRKIIIKDGLIQK